MATITDTNKLANNLLVEGTITTNTGLDVTGNIIVSGTVDGRDVSTDGSNLDSHIAASTAHGVSGTLVGTSDTQTLTNKTVDADNNTITNIANAEIKAGAAIDATKIANGSITNTEFQYLDGATSNIQTQISNHTSNTSNPHSVTKTQVGLSNVENLKMNLTATGAPSATDDTNSGYSVGSMWIDINNDRGYLCLDATASAAVWKESTENNTVSNVGTAGVGVYKGTVGIDFQFKKINAGSNKVTITDDTGNDEIDVDLAEGNIVHQNLSGAGTNTHAQIDSHIAASSGIHGASGTLVGTTDAQTLDNKSFTDSTTYIIDNTDNTKKVQFQVSSISTGTTRTLTVPNANMTLVGTDVTQTLDNKTLTDSTTYFQDNLDNTKKVQFQLSGLTPGATRVLSLPNANDTLVGRVTVDTLTNKTIDGNNNTITNIDHNTLSNLGTGDYHPQYVLGGGRASGQTIIGGTAANDDLTLQSTSHGTKGKVIINDITECGKRVVINNQGYATNYALSVQSNTAYTYIEILNDGGAGKGAFFGMEQNDFSLWSFQGGPIKFYVHPNVSQGDNKFTMRTDGVFQIHDLTAGVVKSSATGQLSSEATGTAFNKNFGTTSGTVLAGDHSTDTTTHGVSGDIMGTSDAQVVTNKTLTDGTTYFQDEGDNTKKMQFQLSSISTGNTRTMTVPNANITILGEANTATITNKTINAANNTITGLTKSDVGLSNVENLKVNLSASVAPTSTDDTSEGYAVGSRWVDTVANKEYVCVDATTDAAIWVASTFSSDDMNVAQARRTTTYSCTGSYADITFDSTDIENNTAVVEHDNTNTERLVVKDTGLYLVSATCNFDGLATSEPYVRFYKNGTTVIGTEYSNSMGNNNSFPFVNMTTMVSLTANDYLTLQVRDIGIDTSTLRADAIFSVLRLTGPKGDQGDSGVGVFGSERNYIASEGESTTTSTTLQTKTTLTTGSLPSGTYRLGYNCEVSNVDSDVVTEVEVKLDGTIVALPNIKIDGDYVPVSGFVEQALSGAITATIKYRAVTTGTAKIRRARLELFRVV